MSCLEQARRNVKKSDIYMGNFYFQALKQHHVDLLQTYGYWDHILKKSPTAHYKIHVPGNPGNELSSHYDHVRCQIPNNRKV